MHEALRKQATHFPLGTHLLGIDGQTGKRVGGNDWVVDICPDRDVPAAIPPPGM